MAGVRAATRATKAWTQSAIDAINSDRPPGYNAAIRTMHNLIEGMRNDEIPWQEGLRELGIQGEAAGLPKEAVLSMVGEIGSSAGRTLSYYSRLQAEFRKLHGMKAELPELPPNLDTPWGRLVRLADLVDRGATKVNDATRRVMSIWMGVVTSLPATALRNMWAGGFGMSLGVIEDSVAAGLGRVFGKVSTPQAVDIAVGRITSAVNRFSPTQRATFDRILTSFPAENLRLQNTPMTEMLIGDRIVRSLQTLNIWQDMQIGKWAVDARLRQTAAAKNMPYEPRSFTPNEVRDAVNHGLEVTFRNRPAPHLSNLYLSDLITGAYSKLPWLRAVGPAFPRFIMSAFRMLYDRTPMPLLHPETYRAMASPDPIKAFKAIGKVVSGGVLIATGFTLDRAGMTGEKWYHIKTVDAKGKPKFWDTRPFYPWAAGLFMGRLLSRSFKYGPDQAWAQMDRNDWMNALISMRRTDLTGIPLLDAIERNPMAKETVEKFKDSMYRLVGNFIGGFAMPARLAGDIAAQFSTAEAIPRTTRESRLLGPTIAAIPGLKRVLPEAVSPFAAKLPPQEWPITRQLTGLTYTRMTPLQQEAARLGIPEYRQYPKTGNSTVDRLIVGKMGELTEKHLTPWINSPGYQKMTFERQRVVFQERASDIRQQAIMFAMANSPEIGEYIRARKKGAAAKRKGLPEPLPVEYLGAGNPLVGAIQSGSRWVPTGGE